MRLAKSLHTHSGHPNWYGLAVAAKLTGLACNFDCYDITGILKSPGFKPLRSPAVAL